MTMVFDFDLRLFCENLKATKPPYECPAPGCGRVYKTYIGIQFHLFNYDHENPDGKNSSTPCNSDRSKQQDASKKAHHRQVCRPSSPIGDNLGESEHELSSSLSPHNVSTKSQRVVEINLNGHVHRIDVYEPMNVLVRQSQASAAESVDKKPPELVACTAFTTKTVSAESSPGAPMIGDIAPVVNLTDASAISTTNAVVSCDLSETGPKQYSGDIPVENVADVWSDREKAESDEGYNEGCSDVKTNDVTCSTVTCFVPASECLPSDSCAFSTDTSLITSDSVVPSVLAREVKQETDCDEPVKPSAACNEKNTLCPDETDIPVSSTELVNTSIISTTCAMSAECDTVKSCNTVSTSTAVISKSAPVKASLPSAEFKVLSDFVRPPKIAATTQRPEYYKFTERTAEEFEAVVEYDMDEEVNIALHHFDF